MNDVDNFDAICEFMTRHCVMGSCIVDLIDRDRTRGSKRHRLVHREIVSGPTGLCAKGDRIRSISKSTSSRAMIYLNEVDMDRAVGMMAKIAVSRILGERTETPTRILERSMFMSMSKRFWLLDIDHPHSTPADDTGLLLGSVAGEFPSKSGRHLVLFPFNIAETGWAEQGFGRQGALPTLQRNAPTNLFIPGGAK